MKPTRIAIVVPSLKVGGMERVASLLANLYAENPMNEVHLLTINNAEPGYAIGDGVKLHQPDFNTTHQSFLKATLSGLKFLRKTLKVIQPDGILSFGDRYNAFVVLSVIGLGLKVYVSNRMNPSLSNGKFVDSMNWIFYKKAAGIIAQTEYARDIFLKRYNNPNVVAIPNPFHQKEAIVGKREKIILNVGRFGDKKNQHLLIRYFNELETEGWQLIFLGDGSKMDQTQEELTKLKSGKEVKLMGAVSNVAEWYEKASIFAFTSTSEGFPNALGEAMAAGCACISFDCEAGPSELIEDGENGFLVPVGEDEEYKEKLQKMIQDNALRAQFGDAAIKKLQQFDSAIIAKRYQDFILGKK